jgi:hypothetical protein
LLNIVNIVYLINSGTLIRYFFIIPNTYNWFIILIIYNIIMNRYLVGTYVIQNSPGIYSTTVDEKMNDKLTNINIITKHA